MPAHRSHTGAYNESGDGIEHLRGRMHQMKTAMLASSFKMRSLAPGTAKGVKRHTGGGMSGYQRRHHYDATHRKKERDAALTRRNRGGLDESEQSYASAAPTASALSVADTAETRSEAENMFQPGGWIHSVATAVEHAPMWEKPERRRAKDVSNLKFRGFDDDMLNDKQTSPVKPPEEEEEEDNESDEEDKEGKQFKLISTEHAKSGLRYRLARGQEQDDIFMENARKTAVDNVGA